MKNNSPLEFIEQTNLCLWLDYNHPKLFYFAIPNGSLRNKQVAIKLKREGVKKGVFDLMIPELKLFLEMKRLKGSSTSKEQKEFQAEMIRIGYHAEIAKGFKAAKLVILKNMNK